MKSTKLTSKDIQKYSKYPLPLAASYLQLSVNELRLQTQQLGFKRWPYSGKKKKIEDENGEFKTFRIEQPKTEVQIAKEQQKTEAQVKLTHFGLSIDKLSEEYDTDPDIWVFIFDKNSKLMWLNKPCNNFFALSAEKLSEINLQELVMKLNPNHPTIPIFKEVISEAKENTLIQSSAVKLCEGIQVGFLCRMTKIEIENDYYFVGKSIIQSIDV
eukprot:gene1349-11431_t